MRCVAALALTFGLVAHADAGALTKASFQTEVKDSGKNAFIKFQAPWCGTPHHARCGCVPAAANMPARAGATGEATASP